MPEKKLKIFDSTDCLTLKKEGYCFLTADFLKKSNEDRIVFYPFKNKKDALTFSVQNNNHEHFIVKMDEELIGLPAKISDVQIYIKMP